MSSENIEKQSTEFQQIPKFIQNDYPSHSKSIVVNTYKNSNLVSDMFRFVQVPPLAPSATTEIASLTFLIDNHFVIDTNRSFLKLKTTPKADKNKYELIKSSSCKWSGGSSYSICGGLAYFNMSQNSDIYPTGNSGTTSTTFNVPLRALNSLFNTDYLYTNLLSGITTLDLNLNNNNAAANGTLFLAVIGNDMFYSTFQSLNSERFLQKFFKCDFITGVNKTQSIGTFSQSVIAVIIFPIETAKTFNIEIGSSAKAICSSSLTSDECFYISKMFKIPETEKVAYFPLYNFSKSDFSGVDASNCTIRYVTDSTNAVNIAVISNAYGEYRNGALNIRGDTS